MRVTVGVLLITYRGSSDEQPIRWVRQDDFTNLGRYINNQIGLEQDRQRINAEVARLKSLGVTDAQFKGAGIDLSRLAQTDSTLSLRSYVITKKYGVLYLDPNRTHTLQLANITGVRLVRRIQAQE